MSDLFQSRRIRPMLIGAAGSAFDDPSFIYEIKWDGVRCVAFLDPNAGTYLHNKRGRELTPLFPELHGIHRQVKKRGVYDGELASVVRGRTAFQAVQRRLLMTNPFRIELAAKESPCVFIPYDLVYAGDRDIHLLPLIVRKGLLSESVREESDRFTVSRFFEGAGITLFDAAQAQGLEGVVAKRRDSLYYFGKETKDWIKCKALLDDDFVVAGYFPKGHVAQLILGCYDGALLRYMCHVPLGWKRREFQLLRALPEAPKEEAFASFPDFPGAVWLRPLGVVTAEYMERTSGGGFRQASFKALRDDKTPEECLVEKLNTPHGLSGD